MHQLVKHNYNLGITPPGSRARARIFKPKLHVAEKAAAVSAHVLPTSGSLFSDSQNHPLCPAEWASKFFSSLSQASRKHTPNAKLFVVQYKKDQIQKIKILRSFLPYQKMQHVGANSYLILASAAALLSVFWNKARIRLFTSAGENSAARGPFPSAHLQGRKIFI